MLWWFNTFSWSYEAEENKSVVCDPKFLPKVQEWKERVCSCSAFVRVEFGSQIV